jgi:hypothetical protein
MFTFIYERVVGKALFIELAEYCLEDSGVDKNIGVFKDHFTDLAGTQAKMKTCRDNIKIGCKLVGDTVDKPKACFLIVV